MNTILEAKKNIRKDLKNSLGKNKIIATLSKNNINKNILMDEIRNQQKKKK